MEVEKGGKEFVACHQEETAKGGAAGAGATLPNGRQVRRLLPNFYFVNASRTIDCDDLPLKMVVYIIFLDSFDIHGHRTLKAPHPDRSAQLTRVPPS